MARKTQRFQPRSRGTIEARGENKWLVRVYEGQDPKTKKRKYASKTVQGTRRDAEKALTALLSKVDKGEVVSSSKQQLGAFIREWLDTKADITTATKVSYKSVYRNYIEPHLGDVALAELNRAVVQRWIADLMKPYSSRTVRYAFRVLAQAINAALLAELIGKNPLVGVSLPKKEHREMATLTPEEVQLLLERTQGRPMHAFWMLLLTGGLRPQEVMALKWTDLNGASLSIRRAAGLAEGFTAKLEPMQTKTEKSARTIRLPKETVEALEAHRHAQKQEMFSGELSNPHGYIFPSRRTGELMSRSWVRFQWDRDLELARIRHVRLYDTRHTHATHLLRAGVHPKVASARLGHSSITVTMDTYSKVMPEMDEEAADTAASLIWKEKRVV